MLGKGLFSKVYLCQEKKHKKSEIKYIACKLIEKSDLCSTKTKQVANEIKV
jgi:hypothetical protein